MLFDPSALLRQLRALAYKNILVTVLYRPAGFVLSTYAFPIAILWLLVVLPSVFSSSGCNRVPSPAPVKSLAETIQNRLIIVQPDGLGPDTSRVIDTFTESIPHDKVVVTRSESDLATLCATNLAGKSECHGAVIFVNSPLTPLHKDGKESSGRAWRYTIRADPALDDRTLHLTKHHSPQEDVYLPLQIAIDLAITNSTTQLPEVFGFTEKTEAEATKENLLLRVQSISQLYAFALFAAYYWMIYRLTRFITSERESGMSQLLDAMGGPMAPASRVLSWLLVLDVLSIPCFIVLGAIYAKMLFPTSSMGVVILWQILLGLAVNSSTVFAAAFFKTSRTSAVYVMGVFLLLSIITHAYAETTEPKPQFGGALFLSLFFPSSSHIFFVQQLSLWEVSGSPVDLNSLPPSSDPVLGLEYGVNPAMLLGFLALQSLLYPCAAILVEISRHGISNRRRTFPTEGTPAAHPFEANDLHKKFYPGPMKRIFCCGARGVNKALDCVSFQGQRGQITCLLGPNGSGKTTTLHVLSGLLSPSSGSVRLGVQWSHIGVCPQRDTFWERLSVTEHIKIWGRVKSPRPLPRQELDQLVEDCGFDRKRTSRVGTLSGGQKRKLQLACAFVGGSTLCLIDECTSGLDPLSRQSIWKILLRQRSRRTTIVLTTHFLDEVGILADDIVIMSKGKIKCQGPAAELTARYGRGYTVAAPVSAPRLGGPAGRIPYTHHGDQILYKTADPRSAGRLCSALSAAGASGLSVSSPSIEDVFMRVVDVDWDLREAIENYPSGNSELDMMTPATRIGFARQVWVIFRKRLTILKHFWWPYLYALVITLVVTPQLQVMLMDYEQPPCKLVKTPMGPAETPILTWDGSCGAKSGCDRLTLGPSSANSTLFELVRARNEAFSSIGDGAATAFTVVQDDRSSFIEYIKTNVDENLGGVFLPSDGSRPLIGYRQSAGGSSAGVLANLWSQITSGVDIVMSQGTFGTTERPVRQMVAILPNVLWPLYLTHYSQEGSAIGITYVIFFTFVQAIYPAIFSLYPAIERSRKIRALQYANAVRRGPFWVGYGLFDFMWVLLISTGVTLCLAAQDLNGPLGAHFIVLVLYGLTGVFTGYIISHFADGPLQAFITTFALGVLFYTISLLALGVSLFVSPLPPPPELYLANNDTLETQQFDHFADSRKAWFEKRRCHPA
jgi:ATP-binding cassette, subfamily A (ABC1), member 3